MAIPSKPTIDNVDRVLSLRRFFTSLRMTIRNHVILSVAKDLKVCVTVDGLTRREILHYVQNDIVGVQNDAVYSDNIVNALTNC